MNFKSVGMTDEIIIFVITITHVKIALIISWLMCAYDIHRGKININGNYAATYSFFRLLLTKWRRSVKMNRSHN